jgi:hypothetical protein
MMKNIILIAFCLLTIIACEKQDTVNLDDFDVTLAKTPSKVGDTAVFNIQGNPDFITFYSGEKGRNYDYANRASADNATPLLTFTTFGQNLSTRHPNTLALLVSKDYNGDTSNISKATWTDITSKAVFSTGTTGTASGTVNLSEFKQANDVYFAFRYKADTSSSVVQPTWTIQSFNIVNLSQPDSVNHTIRAISTAGWQTADFSNGANKWVATTTQLQLAGGAINTAKNEDWAITKVNLRTLNPDTGTPIKTISEKVKTYFYRFPQAGTYKVTFLAAGKRPDLDKTVTKQIEIKIN